MVNPFVAAPGLNDSFMFPVEVTLNIISKRAEDWTRQAIGCTRREFWILLCVCRSRLSQKQLSEALYMHPNAIVKLLDTMEKEKGLIKRTKEADNRRQNIIEPTKKGREAWRKCMDERSAALRHIFQPLTIEEAEQFRGFTLSILGVYQGPLDVSKDDADMDLLKPKF